MTELLNTLYVQTQGASLHLEHDAVRVVVPDTPGRHTQPLRRIESIVLYGHVTVSSELLTRCAQDSRPIIWMTQGGRFLARLDGPVRGNVLLRHAQHTAHANPTQRLGIARACVAGKLQSARQALLRAARDLTGGRQARLRAAAQLHADLLQGARDADDLDQLLGVEGQAGRVYFEAFQAMLRPDLDIEPLTGRTRRPPTDPVNCLLSYGYGLLRSAVHGALEQIGLDPYVGFLHGIRPGKPALALDLMEEFRPLLADRFALNLLNRRQLGGSHFEQLPGGAVRLTDTGRKLLLIEWQKARARTWSHALLGRKVQAALLPVVQARILARHLRGELPAYVPWSMVR